MPQDDQPRWAQYAKPGPYVTQLPSMDEPRFQSWIKQNHIPWMDVPNADYDMRGFWQAAQRGDPNASTQVNREDQRIHFPDTYKTPYHKTFSRQSEYALPTAGDWVGDVFAPPNVNTAAPIFNTRIQQSMGDSVLKRAARHRPQE